MASEDLTGLLDAEGVEYEVLPHRHTESALAEADALGVDPVDVGKTLVVTTPDGNVRVVLSASDRLDLHKLGDLVGAGRKGVHLASEETLGRDYSEFPLGAVPPLGGSRRDPVVVDSRLAARESVVLEAGSHDESIRISRADLVRLTGARVADVAQD
jgi:prolyl-tRNA editing enzyme YbaK/EbsC (Cys-tRNA(Pro) deacylase)